MSERAVQRPPSQRRCWLLIDTMPMIHLETLIAASVERYMRRLLVLRNQYLKQEAEYPSAPASAGLSGSQGRTCNLRW